jgi:membrane carboxypeptidase/penicillin-binding protein
MADEPKVSDDRKQIIDPMTAYQMTDIMEGVVERTAEAEGVAEPIAARPGTTNDEKRCMVHRLHADLLSCLYWPITGSARS